MTRPTDRSPVAPRRSPTPCSTRATSCTPTGPRRGRTRCVGSSACSCRAASSLRRAVGAIGGAHRVRGRSRRRRRDCTCGSAACRSSTGRSNRTPAPASGSRPSDELVVGDANGCRGTRRSSTRSMSRRSRLFPLGEPHVVPVRPARRQGHRGPFGRVRHRWPSGARPCAGVGHRLRDDGLGRRARRTCRASGVTVENTTSWSHPGATQGRDGAPLARGGAHAARGRRRHVPLPARSAGGRGRGARRVPQRRHLPGADRRGRHRGAVVADHPLRPSGGRSREPGRPLRLDRDRRDPGAAGAHAHRRGEGRGARHRRRAAAIVDGRRHAARGVGAAARRGALDRARRRVELPRSRRAVVGARVDGGRPHDRHRDRRRSRGRHGHAGPPPALAAGRRPRSVPRRPHRRRRGRVQRRRRRRPHRRHARRRPRAAELAWQGRYLYFHPDELELLSDASTEARS